MTQNELLDKKAPIVSGKTAVHEPAKSWSLRRRLVLCLVIIGLIYGAIEYGLYYLAQEYSKARLKTFDSRLMKELRQAIDYYRAEYGKLPFLEKPTMSVIRTEGDWLRALMQESKDLNLKGIKFFDPTFAKKPDSRGLYESEGKVSLMDVWGRMYYVIMDYDGDGFIENPETLTPSSNPSLTVKINEVVLIYSAGKDGDPNTWEDNVCSWK